MAIAMAVFQQSMFGAELGASVKSEAAKLPHLGLSVLIQVGLRPVRRAQQKL